jgi:hypothetical protein
LSYISIKKKSFETLSHPPECGHISHNHLEGRSPLGDWTAAAAENGAARLQTPPPSPTALMAPPPLPPADNQQELSRNKRGRSSHYKSFYFNYSRYRIRQTKHHQPNQ